MRQFHKSGFRQSILAISVGLYLLALPAYADVFCQWDILPEASRAAPGGWLVVLSLKLSSPDGERLTEAYLSVNGITSADIADAAIWANDSGRFPQQAHFPQDGKRLGVKLVRVTSGTLRIVVGPDASLPISLNDKTEFLLAVRLAETVTANKLVITTDSLTFNNSGILSLSCALISALDSALPEATTRFRPAHMEGLYGWQISVTPSKPLAFAPQLRPLWTAPIKDWHHWRNEPGWGSAFDMVPVTGTVSNSSYEIFIPHQNLLSGNLSANKKIRYELSPPPDNWGWRKDDGNELIDGDARPGNLVFPGGCCWVNCSRITIRIDLGETAAVSGVVLYVNPRTFTGATVRVGTTPNTLEKIGVMPAPTPPFSRYAYEQGLQLYRATIFFRPFLKPDIFQLTVRGITRFLNLLR